VFNKEKNKIKGSKKMKCTTKEDRVKFVGRRAVCGLHYLVLPTKGHTDYEVVKEHIRMVKMADKRNIEFKIKNLNLDIDLNSLNVFQTQLLLYLSWTVWDKKSQAKWVETAVNDWLQVLEYCVDVWNVYFSEDSRKLKNNPLTVEKYRELLNI
jgi:hypothetical protein